MSQAPFDRLLPPAGMLSEDEILALFFEAIKEKQLDLYPAQEEAILSLFQGEHVILNTPTGSGKSLVATALHFLSMAMGRRSVYTCPIKALVNEKFIALCKDFGAERVGMMTGDGSVNVDAPILCCTAEVLANMSLRMGDTTPLQDVVMDEFHYYSDRERGVSWQIPLLTMPNSRFLLMSATLGDPSFFQKELEQKTGRPATVVTSIDRPVPLTFRYSEDPLNQTLMELIQKGRSPIYLVNFTQRDASDEAQNILSMDIASKDEKKALAEALKGTRFTSPYGKELQKFLRHGVGVHHGGLLPKYRMLVEGLAQKGLLKVISGTDTLGVGVNVPIRTVLFTKLCKYDGEKTTLLAVRDFQQIAGRAGRKGFDNEGLVVAQAPEHLIENLHAERKAAGDPKKLKRLVKKKPPEKGYVPWSKETFDKLVSSPPEPLRSRFQVSHGMLLSTLARPHEDGCKAMRLLIRQCHESDVQKQRLRKTAFQMFRSLVERDIVTFQDNNSSRKALRLNVNLQDDFSLHQSMSLWLIDTLKKLDPTSENYELDVLSLVEAILENPDLVLMRQLDKLKKIRMAEMKAEGVEFDQRIAELETMEYPKPLRDFIYDTFNEFSRTHPWVGQDLIRPKSIARDMYEQFLSFVEYIREYNLERTEGLLLRYLSEVYKVLLHTVPTSFKSPEVERVILYLGTIIRQVDASIVDEWERLKAGPKASGASEDSLRESIPEERTYDLTADTKAFAVAIRNELMRFIRRLAAWDVDGALEVLTSWTDHEGPQDFNAPRLLSHWNHGKLKAALEAYAAEHKLLDVGPEARQLRHFVTVPPLASGGTGDGSGDGSLTIDSLVVTQYLCDDEGPTDFCLTLTLDIPQVRATGRLVMELTGFGTKD